MCLAVSIFYRLGFCRQHFLCSAFELKSCGTCVRFSPYPPHALYFSLSVGLQGQLFFKPRKVVCLCRPNRTIYTTNPETVRVRVYIRELIEVLYVPVICFRLPWSLNGAGITRGGLFTTALIYSLF